MNVPILIFSGLAGIILAGMAGRSLVVLGLFAGVAFGVLLDRLRRLSGRIDDLQRELASTRASGKVVPPAPVQHRPEPLPAAVAAAEGAAPAQAESRPPPAPPKWKRAGDPVPDPFERAIGAMKRWFTEGNVPVKVGVLVLFAGVGALLKYAANQGWLRLPIELRLAGIALAGIAALLFGWRERARRRVFGLALQGGAIGILLMTVFAAFRLYQLLPAGISFGLMLVLVAATGALALAQDSIALAVLGIAAGFAAPILSSTGAGSHVVLFSYYALLNLAIFAIAWRRSWRSLNLLGFAFTFVIGIAWGVLRFEPVHLASVEPFLILFFAIYLAIPVVHALRHAPARRDPVDGTLVFGNPLLSFGLQTGLLESEAVPLAYTALALAGLYALLAWWLIRRARVLGESFTVLAAVFATVAVPLALSAQATACVFALEGAALVWLGFRQFSGAQRWCGLALQALAAVAFVLSLGNPGIGPDALAFANGRYLAALLIAGAGFVSAWLHARHGGNAEHALLLYLWGLAWWIGAGWHEIDRFVPDRLRAPALLAFAGLTAALAGLAWRRVRREVLAWTVSVALAIGVPLVLGYAAFRLRPWEDWALAGLAAYAAAGLLALRQQRDAPDTPLGIAHSGWIWTWTLALALAAHRLAIDAGLAGGWRVGLTVLPCLAAWALALLRPSAIAAPLGDRFGAWRGRLTASQALIAATAFLGMLWLPGDTAPAPFMPVVNPLELMQIGILLCAARWLADPAASGKLASHRFALVAAAGFAFVTAATLRGVHHLGDLPWNSRLWPSMLAQTSLTVVWSALGVAGWVQGSRRGNRPLWLAGAILMGVVLAKLLIMDRSHLGSALGIASFIAYGLLCLGVGYLAPAPPRSAGPMPLETNGEPVR